ncbi:MAG: hypothetical protein R3281_05000 [Balneolaceae bacterium]|nr:hypothetical protein [Balneolaceae bacterium]
MDILFWSGGKDAYLALQFYRREYGNDREISLLTTYNEETDVVPHQNIAMSHIRRQADFLGLPLIAVPLPPECPNEVYLSRIRQALEELDEEIDRLIYGDWKLQDIREWREEQFGAMGYECFFPIWHKDLNELLPVLILQPVKVTISAVQEEYQNYIRVGELYAQGFVRTLPSGIDPMGENGEFHTKVDFNNLKDKVV